MKVFKTRNIVIIGSLAAVIGGVMLLSGFKMGGFNQGVYLSKSGFVSQKSNLETEHKQLSANIRNLEVDTDTLEINIKVGHEFSVESHLNSNEKLQLLTSGDTAKLSLKNPVDTFFSIGPFVTKTARSLTITVPKSDQIQNLNLKADTVSLHLQDLHLGNLTGELDTASLKADKLQVQNLDLKNDASSLTFNQLKLSHSGTITLDAASLKLNQSQLPSLNVTGDASGLTINGRHQGLPYQEATSNNELKIRMDASSTHITN